MMTATAAETGQVSESAAEIYDRDFVPALFGEWAPRLCDAAGLRRGGAVLDVACGTGATTREAAARVGSGGRIAGLDRNDGMLAVARARAPAVDWVEGLAEDLPFEDGAFDAVLCQFGLMFFEDRARALKQMARVTAPGGRLALSVWGTVADTPGYKGMIALIDEMFGSAPADALRAPFCLGDLADLGAVLEAGGLGDASVSTINGTARYPSIRDWARMDVRGWTLSEFIDDDGFEALVAEAERRFGVFVGANGRVSFAVPAHIAVWSKD